MDGHDTKIDREIIRYKDAVDEIVQIAINN